MKLRLLLLIAAVGAAFVLGGCGGSGNGQEAEPAPSPGTQEATVGPFVIETAGSTNVNVQSIAHREGVAFAALSTAGVIDWLGTVEPMDRLVFSSNRSGSLQIHRSNFFGENIKRLTNRADEADNAQWSPDGKSIAYNTWSGTQDIIRMDENGLNERRLTDSPNDDDEYPTWSPNGRFIAFVSDMNGPDDIYKMYSDGTGVDVLIAPTGSEQNLQWHPRDNRILYSRGGSLYSADSEGYSQTTILSESVTDTEPTWHPNGLRIAWARDMGFPRNQDIMVGESGGTDLESFAGAEGKDSDPCYSTDGEWLVFSSERNGSFSLFARQTDPPYQLLRLTDGSGDDWEPDLGSPVRTVTRTLIGPADSDHGYDPVHAHAIAAVAVFGDHGYLNFVRMGIPSNRGSNLEVSALPQSGDELVGVAVSSPEMYYVEQDEGIGAEPTLWDLSRSTSRSVVLYFNANSGDLMSVLDLDDDTSAVTTAAAGPVTHEHSGVSTTVRGSFNAVYGPDGELVTDGHVGTVEIDANQGVVRAF